MLKQKAVESAAVNGAQALGAGDLAIAAGENVERSRAPECAAGQSIDRRKCTRRARRGPQRGRRARNLLWARHSPINCLPWAPVTEGMGRSTQAAFLRAASPWRPAGCAVVTAPAAGTMRFAGPYGDYDGVLIIDHGGGWLSLIVNASSAS